MPTYGEAKIILEASDEDWLRMIAPAQSGGRLEAVKAEITFRNNALAEEAALAQRDAAQYAKANARSGAAVT